MKSVSQIATLFVLVVNTTDAFLPSSIIADRNDDSVSSLMMNPSSSPSSSSRVLSSFTPRQQDDCIHRNGVLLYQSSASIDSMSAAPRPSSILLPNIESVDLPKTFLSNPMVQSLSSVILFICIDVTVKSIFRARQVAFPSSLAGCCAMAATLLVNPYHDRMYKVLSPGAKLLQKFLMVFLVPNLIVLPLCGGCGSVAEVRCPFCGCAFLRCLLSVFSWRWPLTKLLCLP